MTTTQLPMAPMTLDGASVLHQMFRVRWEAWKGCDPACQSQTLREASEWLDEAAAAPAGSQSAAFAMLGHKGDLMLLHFRPDFPRLLAAQAEVRKLRLFEYLEPVGSYVSAVELGLYESTRKMFDELAAKGLEQGTEAWANAVEETLERQRRAMAVRLHPEIPSMQYLCFYPMDKKRGEQRNWYAEDFATRQRMMQEHGAIGRRYAGLVKQVISGSIGFDDWEWGVDLFADNALLFKQLVYEMRFDEASAVYGLFGAFYLSLRLKPEGLAAFMAGEMAEALA
jgi:chlorite dismutase